MRKFLYVLLGVVLIGGAVATFGTRNFGWDLPRVAHSDHGGGGRAFSSREGGGGGWSRDRGGRGGSWLNFSNVLDLLNVLVGVVGIGLTISGMRMQRNAMQMTMRGRD